MKVIQAKDWTAVMEAVAQIMTEQADHLCEMDARMGDGDLGLTMKKGYCALPEIYAGLEEADMGKRLSKAGMKMSSVVPSTMGTLMSSGWMEGGKRLIGKEEVDASAFAAFLRGFADGIAKRASVSPESALCWTPSSRLPMRRSRRPHLEADWRTPPLRPWRGQSGAWSPPKR